MRVICVDDSPFKTTGEPSGLVKYKEYTVVRKCRVVHENADDGVILAEIKLNKEPGFCDCWDPDRFRPIKEVDVNAMFRCEEAVNA